MNVFWEFRHTTMKPNMPISRVLRTFDIAYVSPKATSPVTLYQILKTLPQHNPVKMVKQLSNTNTFYRLLL